MGYLQNIIVGLEFNQGPPSINPLNYKNEICQILNPALLSLAQDACLFSIFVEKFHFH